MLSPALPVSPEVFDPALSENARMFLIGVDRYDNFPAQPVVGANNSIVSWMIQGLRMGISPHGNTVALDATREEVAQIASEVLKSADISEAVRNYAETQLAGWGAAAKTREARWDDWELGQPRLTGTLDALLSVGNHMQNWKRDTRLLFVFCGHGAISQGRLALCMQDAIAADSAAAKTPEARIDALRQSNGAPRFVGPIDLAELDVAIRLARTKGALNELLDLMETPGRYLPLRDIIANLRRLTSKPVSKPAFGGAITPIHLMLALGGVDERVTCVLDACSSGGLGGELQGATVAHDWLRLGLRCRILSSGQRDQRSAEAAFGDRRYTAATWALTTVLSRWTSVPDGPAYAVGITNGNLVLRANLLLEALSFNQQLGLSAPDPASPDARHAADLPFFGLSDKTRTWVDPSRAAGGIQISSDGANVSLWEVRKAGGLKAALLAVQAGAGSFTINGKTYQAGRLYVIGPTSCANDLKEGGFDLVMRLWTPSAEAPNPPQGMVDALNALSNAILANVSAWGDETTYNGPASPPNFTSCMNTQNTRKIWIKWSTNPSPTLIFVIKPSGTPPTLTSYVSPEFKATTQGGAAQLNSFQVDSNTGFSASCLTHAISLG